MLTSLAIIFLLGLLMGSIFNKLKLPSLMGMIFTGILLSPYAFNLLDDKILSISPDLRQLALVIILTRAGLSLDVKDLKKVGRPAVLMCFVPACFEILAVVMIAPKLLGVTVLEAAIMGAVVAAVSPAIIVPRMINLIEQKIGKENSIPQLIMAGASVDDIFVIVLFTAFTDLAKGGDMSLSSFAQIPISIIMGVLVGVLMATVLIKIFKKVHLRDSIKVIIILSVSFLLIELQNSLESIIPMSGLLAIMSMGILIKSKYEMLAVRLSNKYNKLWLAAEIVLFVLVGATVNVQYAITAGIPVVIVILFALMIRMIGVFVCLIKTKLSKKERLFCMIAYTPKATVQAAIGGMPLAMGLSCGNIVLTVAVLAILITAPFGAIGIDSTYKKLLCGDNEDGRDKLAN
ncbi:MAG: cation:proton antiporter [Terrisporobacter othiniensis]|uniref:cation:proton antiporter n=1 Tax=Terrisporobacter petrolearius TaxID=1460447 RepID=UPI0022DEEC6A|nr:cation:proton antiporter [Terrisporobacter petrolearius]MDU4861629.1 cation:proton antiporter [Terrisporobacter othiniensis]MDU6995282.1 cation:proton antiporter [Terrisporobacter othiniensis]